MVWLVPLVRWRVTRNHLPLMCPHIAKWPTYETTLLVIGVRDLVARGYVIPGGASQRGGAGLWRSVSHVVRPGLRSVTHDVPARRILATVQ